MGVAVDAEAFEEGDGWLGRFGEGVGWAEGDGEDGAGWDWRGRGDEGAHVCEEVGVVGEEEGAVVLGGGRHFDDVVAYEWRIFCAENESCLRRYWG